MNLFQIIFVAIGAVVLYEFLARPYFQKRRIARMEKETIQWAGLVGGGGVVDAEDEKKAVQFFLKIYFDTKFNQNQDALKLEVIELLYLYVNTVIRILNQHGIQMTAIDHDDTRGTVGKLIALEKQQHQLENILKNLFEYLKDANGENE